MFSENFSDYYNHMKKTSMLGGYYRKYIIYSTLVNYLKGKCLDIGCGIGNFVRFRKNTDAADINPISIELLKKEGFKAYLIKKNKIPVKERAYDSLLMDNVLEHIQNPNNLLLECKRIIKADGILIIGVPGKKGFKSEVDHKIHYDQKKLISKLENFRFQHVKTFYKPFKLDILDNLLRQYCMYSIFRFQK